jgi:hypothetical protein
MTPKPTDEQIVISSIFSISSVLEQLSMISEMLPLCAIGSFVLSKLRPKGILTAEVRS